MPYRRKTEANVPYNGVLFAKPGMAPISASTALSVVGLFKPYGTVVLRTWTQRLDSYGGYLLQPVTDPAHPDKSISLDAVIGVQMAENGFIAPMPLVAGRWFSSDSAAEIVLSAETASYLGIAKEPFVERTLDLRNRKVRLVGLLDDAKLAAIGDLARLMLLPLKSMPDLVTHTVSETGAMIVSEEDAMAGPAPSGQSLRSQEVAFVPVDFARELPDTSYRSIALKTQDAASAWVAANHFVDATGILTYVAHPRAGPHACRRRPPSPPVLPRRAGRHHDRRGRQGRHPHLPGGDHHPEHDARHRDGAAQRDRGL